MLKRTQPPLEDPIGRLIVAVRIRPLSIKETTRDQTVCIAKSINETTVMIYDPSDDFLGAILRKEKQREKMYQFDRSSI